MELISEPCKPCISTLPYKRLFVTGREIVMQKCYEFFGVDKEYVMKINRKRRRVLIRQMCMYACVIYTNYSLADIGEYFNKKDHTTVIHAKKTIDDLCFSDELVKQEFEELKKYIQK